MFREIELERVQRKSGIDVWFSIFMILFMGMGLVALYSASVGYGTSMFDDPLYFFKSQVIFMGLGFVAMFVSMNISLDWLRSKVFVLSVVCLVLCLMVFLPFVGKEINGASRWVGFGPVQFQPSELLKILFPLFISNLVDKRKNELNVPGRVFYPALIFSGIFCFVVVLQNDFSTAAFLFVLALLMLLMSGIPLRYFIALTAVIVPLGFIVVFSKEHRVYRLLSFFIPDYDVSGASYQVMASLKAIGSGGFWGKGLGLGVKKLSSIPMVQSDFVFSAWAEETGFLGVTSFFIILAMFAWRGYKISLGSGSLFSSMFSFGCVSAIVLQSLMNLGVVVQALPVTGITLPFFSAGGSSYVVTMIMCGIILNISRNKIKETVNE